MTDPTPTRDEAVLTVDALAQEIRRVDGSHSLGAGALAEALMPFLLASAPAPASGGVDAVARRAKYLLNRLETDDGLGIGEIDTMLRMAASLSPAATPGSEAEPVAWQWLCKSTLGYRDRWVNCEDAEDAASKSAAGIELRALYALAKPASSPAGGDVREALSKIERHEISGVTDGEQAWIAHDVHPEGDWVRYSDIAAALSKGDAND